MKVTQIKIHKLFGLYNYCLDFRCKEDDFFVLTSPNGYGKTTLLRIINSLNIKRLYYLYLLKFESISICFEDGSQLSISEPNIDIKEDIKEDDIQNYRNSLSFVWKLGEKEICHFNYNEETIKKIQNGLNRKKYPYRSLGNHSEEYIDEYFLDGEGGESLNSEIAHLQNQEQFLLQLATVQTDFIGANRIYIVYNNDWDPYFIKEKPIEKVVNDLKESLSRYVWEFQKKSQQLDSYLIDLLLKESEEEISEENYNNRKEQLTHKINELVFFGLLNKQTLPPYKLANSKILGIYLYILEEKINFFKDLLPLLQLFNKNIINKQFANKRIILSPQHGLRIESSNGDILEASKLSTGEQNQIVLLYNLIFKTPKGSILLIDEPESSLHVAWQNDFINDMQEIAKIKNLQILIASHSPIIVSNTQRNKVIDLYYLQNV